VTDKPKAPTDPWQVPVIFANTVAGSGHLNGVANFTFATARWTPQDDGTVAPDMAICARLRMDLIAVQQLRDACDTILQQNLKPANGTTH
jgi:hypothetical protein